MLKADGKPLQSFNKGQPVRSQTYSTPTRARASYAQSGIGARARCCARPRSATSTATSSPTSWTPRASTCTRGTRTASVVPGFPVRARPDFSKSTPASRTRDNHMKRGFFASPTLGDLNGDRRARHHAARASTSTCTPGTARASRCPASRASSRIPTRSRRRGEHQHRGRGRTSTATRGTRSWRPPPSSTEPTAPGTPGPVDRRASSAAGAHELLSNAIGGSGRTYALERQGRAPPRLADQAERRRAGRAAARGPGVDPVMANVDGDGKLEVIDNAATGDLQAFKADGSRVTTYDPTPADGRARGQGARAEPVREPDRGEPRREPARTRR